MKNRIEIELQTADTEIASANILCHLFLSFQAIFTQLKL